MSKIDIESTAISLLLRGVGNSYLNNFPFLKVLDDAGSIEYKPLCDGVKNALVATEELPVFTDSSGTGMVEHNKGLMHSIALHKTLMHSIVLHKTLPLRRIINKDQIDLNYSDATKVDPVKAIFGNSTETLMNALYAACMGDGSGGAHDIDGVLAAASPSPEKGTYQGVSGEMYPFWRNVAYNAKVEYPSTPFNGKPTDESNIIKRLNFIMANNQFLGTTQFKYVLLGQEYFNMVMNALADKTSVSAPTDKEVRIGWLAPVLNNVTILNGGGYNTNSKGHKGFPPRYALFFDPSNFVLFYDNPFKRGERLQSLINLNNVHEEFKVKSANDIKSMFYIDVPLHGYGASFSKNPDNLNQWTHIMWKGNLMCRDRRKLSLMYEF